MQVLKILILTTMALLTACTSGETPPAANVDVSSASTASAKATQRMQPLPDAKKRFNIYATVPLTADLSGFSVDQRKMIALLIDASKIMDTLFWEQAYGKRNTLLEAIDDVSAREFARVNYGPWDRLDADKPFLTGVGAKPLGARFYPRDMTREEFAAADFADKDGLYTLVRRNEAGVLHSHPYHEAYAQHLRQAAMLLEEAADLAADPSFAGYLKLRAQALITDDYQPSDMAWLDMKSNTIDVVIGAIETYEDQLYGYRAAYEAYVLIKDLEWSQRLQRFAAFLPQLQRALPVDAVYKQESPGSDSDLNAYDVIYYAGHSNAGSKTIAINLPNDEEVQLAKGTRRLQLKNAMRAKFDAILMPISEKLIDPAQRKNVTFDAFFANTMFHEVAHGLGVKNTINNNGTVRTALKELASAQEEGKADILGLWMITWLTDNGELPKASLMDHYVTFLAGIFRSTRFGASSAHGRANMVRFNFFETAGAFTRNDDGLYRVNFDVMRQAVEALSRRLLMLQGDGDYAGTLKMMDSMGVVMPALQKDLDRLNAADIPVDIVFEQGKKVLGL